MARLLRPWTVRGSGIALLLLSAALPLRSEARDYPQPVAAPPFTQQSAEAWINSEPLTWEHLRGQVVLVNFWTYGCGNCYRSFPWLKSVEERFGPSGLRVVGIHTPEFEHEKQRQNVERKAREFDLDHPVMLDNDYAFWRAMANRYWPTFYLVDKRGRIRAHFIGETHAGDRRARAVEQRIIELLAE